MATAIRLKQPEMFAHRRSFAIDAGPATLQDPSRPWDAPTDIEFANAKLTLAPRRVALWTLTLRTKNPRVAYRDVLYHSTYRDAHGQVLFERDDFIKQIFQPGEAVTVEANDGFVNAPFASAEIKVRAAEALLPLPGKN